MRSFASLARLGLLLGLLVSALRAEVAVAQYAPAQGFRLERWVSTPTSRDGFAVTRPGVLAHGVWSLKLVGNYTMNPLMLRDPRAHAVVAHRLGAELTAALGLWDALQLYARLPFTVFSLGQDAVIQQTSFQAPGGMALSDVALGATMQLFSRRGVQLGARAELVTPSGNRGQLAGDSALAPRALGLLEYTRGPLSFVLNGGVVYRPHRAYALTRIGNELEWGGLVRFDADHGVEFLMEAFGSLGLRDRAGPAASDSFDVLLGGRYSADTGKVRMRSGLALGTGLSDALGDPDLRVLFSLALEPRPDLPTPASRAPQDRDHDGVDDERDECPAQREDVDGFEDADGCADLDDDGDGVPDGADRCAGARGDAVYGCPLADRDGDGIADERDRCPADPENFNGARDKDGCPERDLDADGLDDDADACPDVAGPAEHAGCPGHARFAGDHIRLLSAFEFEDAALAPTSQPLLDDIAALLAARPLLVAEITLWAESLPLATARVQAVAAALVARGIDGTRLNLAAATSVSTKAPEGVQIQLRAAAAR